MKKLDFTDGAVKLLLNVTAEGVSDRLHCAVQHKHSIYCYL